jgi:hypothetical protein
MNNEPQIIINGVPLRQGEAMTVRVALDSFAMHLRATGLGDDEHGKAMTKGYLANIESIRALIFKP